MPLDTMNDVRVRSVVERIGLVPIAQEVLDAHKNAFQERFMKAHPQNISACWTEITQRQTGRDDVLTVVHEHVLREARLSRAIGAWGSRPFSPVPVPAAVRQIADAAQGRMRAEGVWAERVVGYFYTDPYVCLRFRENGKTRDVCLAIWDGETVLNVATLN